MSWPIRFLTTPPLHPANAESRAYDGTVDFAKFAVGDLAFYHHKGVACCNHAYLKQLNLTAHYFAHNFPKRAPLILALPDRASPNGKLYFLVDGQCYSNKCTRCGLGVYGKCKCPEPMTPRGYYDGWTVAGEPPMITVSPSVNYDNDDPPTRHYHGFIQNGVIGDG